MVNRSYSTLALACLGLVSASPAYSTTSLGKEFTLAFPTNHRGSGQPVVFLSAREAAEVTISVAGLSLEEILTLEGGEVRSFALPQSVNRLGHGEIKNLAVNISSDADIAVFGLNAKRYTTDGFLAFPNTVVGQEYIVQSFSAQEFFGLASELVVVATEDDTDVHILPSKTISEEFKADEYTHLRLDRNQTFQLTIDEGDLTGTRILADKPVVVYGAHECADVPSDDPRVGWCDHLVQTMVPVDRWGYHHDIVPLATRQAGDIYRVLAAHDETQVVVNNQHVATLNLGEFYEGTMEGPISVRADKPVYVAQYSMGQGADGVEADPFMMSVIPQEQFLDDYLFTTPEDGFAANFLNVVMEPGTELQLNGNPVDTSHFMSLPGSIMEGGQISLDPGQHRITGSAPFGAYVYGFNAYDSYGYPAGQAFRNIESRVDPFPPNVRPLRHVGNSLVGAATDSEDVNANGILDPGEDLNGNGIIDGRVGPHPETGEMGQDQGIVFLELSNDSSNLTLLQTHVSEGQWPRFEFKITLQDPTQEGSGTLIATDLGGNRTEIPVHVPVDAALADVELISRVAGEGVIVDPESISRPPETLRNTAEGVEIVWHFDRILANELREITYEVSLLDTREGEQRLITRSLDLSYINRPNGERQHRSLGPQSLQVLSSAFELSLNVSEPQAGPDTDLSLIAEITNLAESAHDAELNLWVEDDQGNLLASLNEAITDLPGGQSKTLEKLWNTANLYTGQYQLIAEVSRNGQVVNSGQYSFEIVHSQDLSHPIEVNTAIGPDAGNGITLEQTEFNTTAVLPVSINLNNVTSNAMYDGGPAIYVVQDDQGNVVLSNERPLNSLGPGSSQQYSSELLLEDAPPGEYQVWVYIYDRDGNLAGVDSYEISIIGDAAISLTTEVVAEHAELLRGDEQQCHETVSNTGDTAFTNVTLQQGILEVDQGNQTSASVRTVHLDMADVHHDYFTGVTDGLGEGTYACLLTTQHDGEAIATTYALFQVFDVIADPGQDRTLYVNDILRLDATDSRETDGRALTYEWSLLKKPEHSSLELEDSTAAVQEFRIDEQGEYVFELRASNGDIESEPKLVRIQVPNRPPNADAGSDQAIELYQRVFLNGLNSTDPDGDQLSYEWSWVRRPEGSTAQLETTDAGRTAFTVDTEGNYIAELGVSDGQGGVDTDTVLLSADNVPPVADAGPAVSAQTGDTVTLDGSGSFDANNDPLTYFWRIIRKPADSEAELVNSAGVRPFFEVDARGEYEIELIVSDGAEDSEPDQVVVTVGNSAPIANAGDNDSIQVNEWVYLDGSASFDPDGEELTYLWQIISTPVSWGSPHLYNADSAEPYFYASWAGDYVVQLQVSDGQTLSEPDTVILTTENSAPSAFAYRSGSGQIYTGDRIDLYGSGHDPDGDPLTLQWRFASKPEGSLAELQNPTTQYPFFTVDKPGDYVVQLIADDGELQSPPATVHLNGAEACVANLDIRPKHQKVQLTWDYSPDTEGVDIYRATDFEGPYTWHAYTENTYSVHIDEDVENGTQYFYRLSRTIHQDGGSGPPGGGYGEFSLSVVDDGYGGYGDYGGYGGFFQACESQIISGVPDRRVRYGLVPDVRGFWLEEAVEMLQLDGFTVGEIIPVRTNAISEGKVLRQNAPRNSRLPRDSEVHLYIANWSQ